MFRQAARASSLGLRRSIARVGRVAPQALATTAVDQRTCIQAGLMSAWLQQQQQLKVWSSRQFHSSSVSRAADDNETFLDRKQVTERVLHVVTNFEKVDPKKVTPDAKFVEDLGLDSLDAVELVMAVEDEFVLEIPDQEADKIASIQDIIEYVVNHPMAA